MTTRLFSATEYRFVVPGPAVSFRSPKAKDYKARVRREAAKVFPSPPVEKSVDVWIDYFHLKRRKVDTDNVAKCILDALNRVAYVDDRQVGAVSSRAFSLLSVVELPGGPVDLVKPLKDFSEYTFVRVREAVDRAWR